MRWVVQRSVEYPAATAPRASTRSSRGRWEGTSLRGRPGTGLGLNPRRPSFWYSAHQRDTELLAAPSHRATSDTPLRVLSKRMACRRRDSNSEGAPCGLMAPSIVQFREMFHYLSRPQYVCDAESLDFVDVFDLIFCNSAFQWFRNPGRALRNCFRALRAHGRMGVQAPARADYCPNFIQATAALLADPRTCATFLRFRSPWFLLETPEAYADLFEASGFVVRSCQIEKITEFSSPARVLEMFESGASAGYLNPDCYDVPLPLGSCRPPVFNGWALGAGPSRPECGGIGGVWGNEGRSGGREKPDVPVGRGQ